MHTLALFGTLGTPELIVLALLGLLIFGKRLPEVGRGLGKSIVEFRKGIKGVEDEVETQTRAPARLSEAPPIPQPPISQAVAQNPAPPAGAA
jgi:sec-independent protein translocase protein TatA